MQLKLVRSGAAMNARAMVLHNGSKPKGADLTANTGTFKEEDVEDRRRPAALYLDEFADGSASLQIVLEGVTVPAPLPGGTRRDLGPITVRRGASFVVDAGTGTVTDTTEAAPASTATATTASAAEAGPVSGYGLSRWSRFFIGFNGGVASMDPTVSFCQDNETRLGTVGATQDACGNNATSGAYGLSVGYSFARVGAWDLFGAGGYASFGRAHPEADGSARTFTITRRLEQDFTGPWVGGGIERNWSSWRLRPTLGVAYVRRETTTFDTFTRLSDRFVSESNISRDVRAFQPMVSVELFRRAGPLLVGTGYRYTQYKDDVLTQRLHSIFATLGWSPSNYRRPVVPVITP